MGSFKICDCVSCVAIGKWTEELAIYHEVCEETPFYIIKVVKVLVVTVKEKNKNVGDIWQMASLIPLSILGLVISPKYILYHDYQQVFCFY